MKRTKKVLLLLLSCALLVAMSFVMAACSKKGNEGGSGEQGSGEQTTYTVTLQTAGGMLMSEMEVYIYADDSLSDLIQYGSTNEDGQANFSLAKSDKYAIVLSKIPKGYDVAESYPMDGEKTTITLTSSLISDGDLSTATLGVGDVMYDFTVTIPSGEKVTLSEVLKEKKMVLLNFWYTTCTWCLEEFPYMEEAYQMYKDDIEIIALNPFENNAAVQPFQTTNNLSFIMTECPASWSSVFGISGYPTSIVVDKYGVICLLESGGITSLRPFTSTFEYFTAEDYQQKIFTEGIGELVTRIKPDVTMPSSEKIGKAINSGKINVTYRPETEDADAEYMWPFVIDKKKGKKCIKASNAGIDDSYAIIYADIEVKKGQAIGFDYLVSSESYSDILYVIVNDEDIYQISGVSEKEKWVSCYPCVAEETGTYELALCFMKDSSGNEGDDTVYVTNMRVVDADDIDVATYLPRKAATTEDGFKYDYVDIKYNKKDGYYHVGSANGPLLLANLMGSTDFSEEESVFDIVYESEYTTESGDNLYDSMLNYFTLASNSSLNGICTVDKGLAKFLQRVATVAGFDGDKNEWLKICEYYKTYGTNGSQLEDPIKGLTKTSAYTAKLGKNIKTNSFYYNRVIVPRGLFAKFVPTKSGVYRITSHVDNQHGVEGWIFDKDLNQLYVYEHDERMYEDDINVSMVYYMEKGVPYYINIAFWDLYEVGTIPYDIEYVASSYELFRACSPGYFTYDTDATGEAMYDVISGGIDVILKNGKYYEDLGKDKNGKQLYGSLIYADFSSITSIFDAPIATQTVKNSKGKTVTIKGLIDKGAFDFTKNETDQEVLAYMAMNDNDVAKTDAYLKELWGDEYDANAESYQLEDVYNGIYHGKGKDYTKQIKKFLKKMDTSNTEKKGCVVVTKELAEILQMLMDKFTFEEVENSWIKLCFYYDYLGPDKNK